MKELHEISYKIYSTLNERYKSISKSNAIKNSAMLISQKIIDIFMECFIESSLKKLKSDDNKTFIESQITKGFSNDVYKLRRKLFEYKYTDLTIREVKRR